MARWTPERHEAMIRDVTQQPWQQEWVREWADSKIWKAAVLPWYGEPRPHFATLTTRDMSPQLMLSGEPHEVRVYAQHLESVGEVY